MDINPHSSRLGVWQALIGTRNYDETRIFGLDSVMKGGEPCSIAGQAARKGVFVSDLNMFKIKRCSAAMAGSECAIGRGCGPDNVLRS